MSNKRFVDVDFSFKKHPVTSDIGTKTNTEAIKTSIRNIIRTAPYDRKFHPEISCRTKNILFKDISAITIRAIKELITNALETYEPRISLETILVSTDTNLTQYNVIVYFKIQNVPDTISVTTLLNRIR